MTHIGDTERQFLETPNSIKGACYDYHGNVFINNQCKIILNNYEKLCGVVSNEPVFMSIYLVLVMFIYERVFARSVKKK